MTASPPELRRPPGWFDRAFSAPFLGAARLMDLVDGRTQARPERARQDIRDWDELQRLVMAGDRYHKMQVSRMVRSTVTEDLADILCEPPAWWTDEQAAKLGNGLCNHWSGTDVIWQTVGVKGQPRQLRVQVVKRDLPVVTKELLPDGREVYHGGITYPETRTPGPGLRVGVDLLGQEVRLLVGPGGSVHATFAGVTGTGKTTLLRNFGIELDEAGHLVIPIDPKGDGDFYGVSSWMDPLDDPQEIDHVVRQLKEGRRARSAGIKEKGLRPQYMVVLLGDETMALMTENILSKEGRSAFQTIIGQGRSGSVHSIGGVLQASAAAFGGEGMGTFVRNNHQARGWFNLGSPRGDAEFLLKDRGLNASHMRTTECMGRMLCSFDSTIRVVQCYGPHPRDRRTEFTMVDDREDMRRILTGGRERVVIERQKDSVAEVVDTGMPAAGAPSHADRILAHLPADGSPVLRSVVRDELGMTNNHVTRGVKQLRNQDPCPVVLGERVVGGVVHATLALQVGAEDALEGSGAAPTRAVESPSG